jgi:NitT/TauT family transport system substrate-binding protein
MAAAVAAGTIGGPRAVAAKAAFDTTAIRIAQNSSICLAPMYACAELLRADGFGEIRFVELAAGTPAINATAQGEVDFAASLPVVPIKAIGAGLPVTVLGGVHVGCYELFAHGAIAGADGKRLWRLARLRGRGFGPVLCGALARGGHGQVRPAEDHRRRRRLTLPRRGEARAEDLSGRGSRCR